MRPIRPSDSPDPLNPHEVGASIVKDFYRLKKSGWYIPLLAILAFVVGYYLFITIFQIETRLLYSSSFGDFPDREFLLTALIEQVVLGIAVFFFLALSRTYQLTLFIYAGFLTYHIQLITGRMTPGEPLLILLTPVFIYAFTGLLVTLGLLFNKKLGLLFLVMSTLLLAQLNTKILTGHGLNLKAVFSRTESSPPTQESSAKQVAEEIPETGNTFGADGGNTVEETSPIQWRSLDAQSVPLRTLHNSDLNSNFCFYHVGDINGGKYAGNIIALITVQVDTPCDAMRPLKSYAYVVADPAGNTLAWKADNLYFQYEDECEDPFDFGAACLPSNYRRYLGLLDNAIDIMPLPPEFTKLVNGYIFTKSSPNRAAFRITDRDFYTLFPFSPSDATEVIDTTNGGTNIVREERLLATGPEPRFLTSYYAVLPFGKALFIERVPSDAKIR